MITRVLPFSGLLVLALFFVAACGGVPASSDDAGTAPTASSASSGSAGIRPTAVAEPTAAAKPTAAPSESSGGETRDIKDISGSLDALKSYRLHFTFSFDAKDDQGKQQKGGMEYLQEVIKASNDRHLRFSSTGAAGDPGKTGSFEFFQIAGTSYIYSPDGQADQKCIGVTSGQDSSALGDSFKPSDIVGGLQKAKLVGKGETVNGVSSNHYTFDQNAVTFGAFSSAKGDVWLAEDGGFLVKYIGTATGKDNFLAGKQAEGTFTWEYNVEDANQVEVLTLPKECEGQKPADDVPVPEGVTDKASFGQITTFKSPDAPADVAAFYKKQMPAQGWKAGEASAMGDLQTINFSKDSRKLSITITKEEQGGSSVLITEEKGS